MAQFKNKTEIAIEKQKYWRIEKKYRNSLLVSWGVQKKHVEL